MDTSYSPQKIKRLEKQIVKYFAETGPLVWGYLISEQGSLFLILRKDYKSDPIAIFPIDHKDFPTIKSLMETADEYFNKANNVTDSL